MQNLLEIQDALRSAPDQQLMGLMQNANASVPQWAVASELNNRKEMRDEQTRQEGLGQPTIVDQLTGQAPTQQTNAAGVPQGIASGMAQSMAPQTDVAQNTGIKTVAPNTAAPVATMASGGILKLASGSFPKYSEPYEEKYTFSYPEGMNQSPTTLKPTDRTFPHLLKAIRKLGGTITEARSGQVMKGDSAEQFSLELDYGEPFEPSKADNAHQLQSLLDERPFTRSSALPPSVISQAQLASMVTDGGASGLERFEAEKEENLPKDMQRKLDVLALARGGAGAADIANSLGMRMIDVIDIGMGIVGNGTLRASALVLDLDAWLNGTLAGDVISAEQFAKDATAMREFADGLFLNDGDWMPRASNMLEEVLSLPNKGDNAVAESAAYQASLDTNTANPELRTKINAMSDSMPVFAEGAPVEYTQAGLASLNAPIGRADDVGEFDKYIDARKATQKIKSDAETQERRLRLKEQSDNPPLWLQAEDEFLNPEELSIDAELAQLKAEAEAKQRSEQAARYVDEKHPGILKLMEDSQDIWKGGADGSVHNPLNPDFRDMSGRINNELSANQALDTSVGAWSFNDLKQIGEDYPDHEGLVSEYLEQHDFSESADNRFEKPGARNIRKGLAAVSQPDAARNISARNALISDTPVNELDFPQSMNRPEYDNSGLARAWRKNLREVRAQKDRRARRLRLKEQSDNPPLWLQAEDEFLNPEELSIDAASVDTDSVGGAGGVNTDGTGGTGVAGSTGAGSKLGAADSYKSQLAGILDKMESSRDHDKWLSLAEMGMRLMASTNPNIVSAVGESGLGALQGYKEQQSADEKQQLNILGKLADIDLTERTLASRESIARNKPAMTTSQVMRIEREAYDDALETYTTLIRSGATGDSDQRFLLKNALEKLGKAEARVNKLYKQYNLPLVDSSISRPTIIQTGT